LKYFEHVPTESRIGLEGWRGVSVFFASVG